jgi:hypothetical protein
MNLFDPMNLMALAMATTRADSLPKEARDSVMMNTLVASMAGRYSVVLAGMHAADAAKYEAAAADAQKRAGVERAALAKVLNAIQKPPLAPNSPAEHLAKSITEMDQKKVVNWPAVTLDQLAELLTAETDLATALARLPAKPLASGTRVS